MSSTHRRQKNHSSQSLPSSGDRGLGPRRFPLTYRDFQGFPEDGRRHELISGQHCVSASPSIAHQTASGWLFFELYRAIAEPGHGRVFHAPTDLYLNDRNVFVPDIMVILESNELIVDESLVRGGPDLVVEILSPSYGSGLVS